jgi:predicted ribosome quality control (RQC) complex YloA/Tae2 family protein
VKRGASEFTTVNFYDEALPQITIALDPSKPPGDNAQAYFKKYNKQKRTYAALQEQISHNENELKYLESVLTSLQTSGGEDDIQQIRNELIAQSFLKKKAAKRKNEQRTKPAPLKCVVSDGFEVYIGKNNSQNDELTFRFAMPDDLWFHAKDVPGSHVILRKNGRQPTALAITESAEIAGFYSKSRHGSNVPIDYTERKNVKKPNGAKPGFVIYEIYRTAYITPKDPFPG